MFRFVFGLVTGAVVAVLLIGYVTGPPDLPGKEWFKRWGPASQGPRAHASTTLWTSQPRVVNGQVEITAWGAASMEDSKSRSHAVALALRTARHLAYEQLAEYLRGARTRSQSQYDGDVLQRAALTTQASAVIRGAKILKEEVKELRDGSVRAVVTVRHPLPRKDGA